MQKHEGGANLLFHIKCVFIQKKDSLEVSKGPLCLYSRFYVYGYSPGQILQGQKLESHHLHIYGPFCLPVMLPCHHLQPKRRWYYIVV